MQMTIQDYLNTYFSHFEPNLRNALAERCSLKSFVAGEQLMQTGQYFKSTMLIVGGLVKVYRQGDDGGEFFDYHLERAVHVHCR